MRFILSSDWQASPANIAECEIAHDELKTAVRKYKPNAVINLGDFKEAYDPVPGIVLKFWIRATREISEMVPYYALMGNHDRFSQSLTSDNWMDALAAAGARAITNPTWIKSLNAVFLPYATREKTLEWAEAFDRPGALLFFHCEVIGSTLGYKPSAQSVTPEELNHTNYAACFGGHIHEHHGFADNMFYVGSPFCMDWGEANQQKGLLLVDTGQANIAPDMIRRGYKADYDVVKVKQIVTKIPHWYDYDYLQSTGKKPEPGAFVRVKVPVATKKVMDELHTAEQELLTEYGDINVFAVPEITRSDDTVELIPKNATDEQMLTMYISATMPEAARFKPTKALEYLQRMLPPLPAITTGGLRFMQVKAQNVLCFEDIKIDYRKQGLVVLRGVNKHWPKRSNGSGKSSALALLTIAFSGQNIKSQKNDEWASEFNDDPAVLKLWIRSAAGKMYRIERSRRPHKLALDVDGVDMSTGIVGTRKGETQGRIEEMLGMDLRTLLNSVYIDQTVANGFLFGTQSARMDLMAKLLNLDRFEVAIKAVKAEIDVYQERLDIISRKDEQMRQQFTLLKDQYQNTSAETESGVLDNLQALEKELADLVAEHADLTGHAPFYKELQIEIDAQTHDVEDLDESLDTFRAHLLAKQTRIKAVDKLIAAGKCSQCGMPVSAMQQHEAMQLKEEVQADQHKISRLVDEKKALADKLARNEKKLEKYMDRCIDMERDLENKRAEITRLDSVAARERERIAEAEDRRAVLKVRLQKLRTIVERLTNKHKAVSVHLEMLIYARSAFHRNGIPLAISMSLCPVLNAAAEEFSEIFNGGKIKVRFSVEDGDFTVEVVNTAGSGATNGQSVGEAAMSGIICAFALREAAPRTNLLVLDEPGHGLDVEGQKEFARGLMKIKEKYETIIVTTHSEIIESILGTEAVWTVTKDKRISRLTT